MITPDYDYLALGGPCVRRRGTAVSTGFGSRLGLVENDMPRIILSHPSNERNDQDNTQEGPTRRKTGR